MSLHLESLGMRKWHRTEACDTRERKVNRKNPVATVSSAETSRRISSGLPATHRLQSGSWSEESSLFLTIEKGSEHLPKRVAAS